MSKPDFEDIEESRNPVIRAFVECTTKMLSVIHLGGLRGPNLIMRAVASVTWEYRRKQFIKAHEVKDNNKWMQGKSLHLYPSILDPSIFSEKTEQESRTTGYKGQCLDHVDIWMKSSKPYLITSQPYFVSKDDLRKLIDHCDKHDIDFQIDAESFYSPGNTIRILFKKGKITPYDATAHGDQEI